LQCQFGTVISLIIFLTGSEVFKTWLAETFLRSGPDFCLRVLPTTPMQPLYNALVCGANLAASHEKQIFVDTGLIHLMVVSGSHLVFIEILLGFLPRFFRVLVLGAYCYLTGLQAPVIRAFLRRLIGPWLTDLSDLTSLQLEAVTVLVALTLYPEWLLSRSFLMSWMCGLALCAPKMIPKFPHLDQALKSYFFLLPFCWASPMTVAWNTLLAPFVGFILFPACILAILIHPLVVVSDLMWSAFLGILNLGPQASQLPVFLSSWELCWIPVVAHILLLYMEVKWRRAAAFSCSYQF
jgi:predicted membrane metal-binding protein